ncbi:MAG: hypothetical protein ACR2KY_01940 [Thermoleophilaceae bacterium]
MTRAAVVGAPRERDRLGADRGQRRRSPRTRPLWSDQELAPEVRRMPDADRREERPRIGCDQLPDEAGGRRPTLGDLVTSAWEGLLSAGSAPCPVCTERMQLHEGTGRCAGCGARLS